MNLRPRALLLALATVLLAIWGNWGSLPGLERLWRLPAALLLAGLAYEAWRMARTRLRLQILTATPWYLGRPTPLQLQLDADANRSLMLQLIPSAPAEVELVRSLLCVQIPVGQPGRITLSGSARRLGHFRWPEFEVRVGGVLGLAWWTRQLDSQLTLQVVPDLLRDRERSVALILRGAQVALQPGTGSEVLQLREYRPGDPPRAIDWKATARVGRIVSRDFSTDQGLQIVLVVDAGRSSAQRAGATDRQALYANVACRLAQRATLLEDRVGLVAYADRPLLALAPARGSAAVMRVRSALAELQAQDAESSPLLAALRVRSLVQHRSLVVLLTALDEAAVLPQLAAAVRLLLPKHLPLIAAVKSEQAEQLAAAPVEDTVQAYRALAAQEFRATVERNLRALHALGAQSVLSSAQHLDQAILDSYVRLRQRRRVG
jgi:uncharacterized protein (DUF58 family)